MKPGAAATGSARPPFVRAWGAFRNRVPTTGSEAVAPASPRAHGERASRATSDDSRLGSCCKAGPFAGTNRARSSALVCGRGASTPEGASSGTAGCGAGAGTSGSTGVSTGRISIGGVSIGAVSIGAGTTGGTTGGSGGTAAAGGTTTGDGAAGGAGAGAGETGAAGGSAVGCAGGATTAGGAGTGSAAGGVGGASKGRNPSGSRYPLASAVVRIPR